MHLLSIFDVDFYGNEKKIKMYLKSLFVPNQRVYARKTEIREVSLVDSKEFYNKYHLQGASIGGVISYGLYLNEELLSVMSFGKQRFNPKGEGYYELYRYCVKDGYTIVGGAEKLHRRFLNDYNVKEVVSYSDNDYFLGGIYVKLGYSMECQCNPRYYWWSRDEVYTREQCMLKQLKRRYPDVFERFNNQTGNKEDKIMISKGFYKVYRSGNKRWVLRRG